MKKRILATTLAVMLGTSMVASNTALAFGFGDVANIVSGGPAAGATEEAPDMDGLTGRQERMLDRLASSTLLFSAATVDVYQALELDPKIIGEQNLIFSNLSGDKTNKDYVKKAASEKIATKEVKAAAKAALASGDQDKIGRINEAIKSANLKKQGAYLYTGLALADAVSVIKEGSRGMKGFSGEGQLIGIVKSAQAAQSLCNAQNKQIKALNEALAEYSASQNIEKPSDEESQAAADSFLKG